MRKSRLILNEERKNRQRKIISITFYLNREDTRNYLKYYKQIMISIKIKYFLCPIITVTFAYIFYTLNLTTDGTEVKTKNKKKS